MIDRMKFLGLAASAVVLLAVSAHAQTRTVERTWSTTTYSNGTPMVTGSGVVVEERRDIRAFDTLAIDGPVNVVIRQGAPALTIRAEDNIIDLVETKRRNGELTFSTSGSFRTRKGITAFLTVPSLEKVRINASGDVRFDGWDAEAIALEIGGSGDIELGGSVRTVRALIGGSGDIDLAPARMRYVDADIEGSGTIHMGSVARLDATINGSGTIKAGNVGELDALLNGSGEILYRSADRIVRESRNGSGRIARH